MSDYCRNPTHHVARKAHRCIYCYWEIPIGELYTQQTGYWEGYAFRNRFHDECFYVLSEDGEFEFTPGEGEPPERLKKDSL